MAKLLGEATSHGALRVLVAGSSGMVGTALQAALSKPSISNNFHPHVYSLVRRPPRNENEIFWDPYEGRIDVSRLEGFDAIVNLAGENAGSGEGLLAFTGRWTDRKKHWIMESRRRGNQVLAQAAACLDAPPKVMVFASGVGYYGSDLDGSKAITEEDPKGTGFLSDVAAASEAEIAPATAAGIRTVVMRLGVIMDTQGGLLERLLLPFKLGLGGPLGSGSQYMSWLTLEDAVRCIKHCIGRPEVSGIINVTSPNPVTNADFAAALGRAVHRPAVIPVPEAILKTVVGEFAEDAMLASQRVVPTRLTELGFRFKHATIDDGLRAALAAQ